MCALVLISPATTHRPGGDQRLARDPAVRVLGQDRVEDAVADLVGHLVGVTLGDRLRRERVPTHELRSSAIGSAGHARSMLDGRAVRRAHPAAPTTRSSTSPASCSLVSSGVSSTLAVGVEQQRPVGVDLEAGVGRAHVVGDDEVDPLGRELGRPRSRARSLGLGREPDHDLARPLGAAERGEDVGGGLEHDLGDAVGLLELLRSTAPWAGSRRPPRP